MTTAAESAVLAANDVYKIFAARGRDKSGAVRAVDGVNLTIERGRTVAVVGQSGSGKTTLGRMFTGLEMPTTGAITLDGQSIGRIGDRSRKGFAARVQPVFQDPYGSLDPRKTILESVSEPLRFASAATKDEVRAKALEALERVGLRADQMAERYPHSLSGGQRQRVAIARAVSTKPDFIIADEPVSMLDVSLQAGVLNLFSELQHQLGCGYLFITHDLAVARYVADTIAVMYRGRIVEIGPRDDVVGRPQHPYTRLLLDVGRGRHGEAPAEDPEAVATPDAGCSYNPLCARRTEKCTTVQPALELVGQTRVACFHPIHPPSGPGNEATLSDPSSPSRPSKEQP